MKKKPPKSLMMLERLFPGFTEDNSEQDTQRQPIWYWVQKSPGFTVQQQPDSYQSNLCWRDWTLQLRRRPPPFSTPSTNQRNPQLGHTCKKQPSLQLIQCSTQYKDTAAQPSRSQQCQKLNRVGSPPSTMTTPNQQLPRKSRLSAPEFQRQLSFLSDRTRLRRKKHTLHTNGAWQQVTRIEDLCHTRVSHKWLCH